MVPGRTTGAGGLVRGEESVSWERLGWKEVREPGAKEGALCSVTGCCPPGNCEGASGEECDTGTIGDREGWERVTGGPGGGLVQSTYPSPGTS